MSPALHGSRSTRPSSNTQVPCEPLGPSPAMATEARTPLDEVFDILHWVFSDADKEWYTQYFIDLEPKLAVGGRFTAHNVSYAYGDIKRFLDHVRSLPNYQTIIERNSSSGISISYKTR